MRSTLARRLADVLYPEFADLFVLEQELVAIETSHDLDDPDVIAALATCADLAPAQKRLSARPPAALVAGLSRPAEELRPTARVLSETLLAAARRELVAGAPVPRKKRPAFAVPERLPVLTCASPRADEGTPLTIAETDAVLARMATGESIDPERYTARSRAAFGRALVFGWLAHGGDPKARWAALGSAAFLDDQTIHDLATFAMEIVSRIGQFSKATALVDVIAGISSPTALATLAMLATHSTSRSLKNAARTALQQAATRMDMSPHDLADRLMGSSPEPAEAEAFVRRLELRMLGGLRIPMRELVESILQNPAARELARGVIFAAGDRTFTIAGERVEDARGDAVEIPSSAMIGVAYPPELAPAVREAWTARGLDQPFPQLAREIPAVESLGELERLLAKLANRRVSANELSALEPIGWKRGPLAHQRCRSLVRELVEVTVTLRFSPGFGAKTPAKQRLTKPAVRGTAPTAATVLQIARELETLARPPEPVEQDETPE